MYSAINEIRKGLAGVVVDYRNLQGPGHQFTAVLRLPRPGTGRRIVNAE